jgi:hypothetical protein
MRNSELFYGVMIAGRPRTPVHTRIVRLCHTRRELEECARVHRTLGCIVAVSSVFGKGVRQRYSRHSREHKEGFRLCRAHLKLSKEHKKWKLMTL